MIWLTWRHSRGALIMMSAIMLLLAAILVSTGPGLASGYAAGIRACAGANECDRFFDQFFGSYDTWFLVVTAIVLILPAVVGLFWGAPMVARELEAGTHLLVWSQTVTRRRWLAIKLAVTGLASMAVAGLASLAVTWWSSPLDKSAAPGFALMDPLVFGSRGIIAMAYAAFAFVLGVTVGMLLRRTLPAMALTLAVFAAVQIAMPLVVRPHLMPPVHGAFALSFQNVDMVGISRDGKMRLVLEQAIPGHTGAWLLSSYLSDPSGRRIAEEPGGSLVNVSTTSGPCKPGAVGDPEGGCLAEVSRLGYRQQATYQPFERFWAFQWIETGLYALLTLGLTGLSFWWIRRRLS
jgi:ABC-type transport system involved in multi-copper enzyme maturation permease subunit